MHTGGLILEQKQTKETKKPITSDRILTATTSESSRTPPEDCEEAVRIGFVFNGRIKCQRSLILPGHVVTDFQNWLRFCAFRFRVPDGILIPHPLLASCMRPSVRHRCDDLLVRSRIANC